MTIGIIAGIISLSAFIPYLLSILKGKTKPNRVSWWIWSWLGVLLYLSYKDAGANETLWVPLTYIVTPFITALLSIKYGVGGWTRFDISCLACSVAGTVVWYISQSATTALMLFLAIDLFGSLPTVRKTYFHPEQEDKLAWSLMVAANLLNIFAAEQFSFSIIIYPLYMFLCGSVILALTFRKSILKPTFKK